MGSAIEGFLASARYQGFAWTNRNFPVIDFIKDGLGVSVKTTNAKGGFNNIMKNIDDLSAGH